MQDLVQLSGTTTKLSGNAVRAEHLAGLRDGHYLGLRHLVGQRQHRQLGRPAGVRGRRATDRLHGNAGAAGSDPQGHRNLGAKGGPPVPKPGNNLGGGGGTGFGG